MCITSLWKQYGSNLHIAHTLAIPVRVDTFQMPWIRWVRGVTVNTECSADLLQTEEQMCEVSEIAILFADLCDWSLQVDPTLWSNPFLNFYKK